MNDTTQINLKAIVADDNFYKKLTWQRKVFNRLLWFPLGNRLPKGLGTWIFTKSSEHTKLIRQYAKTYQALELMYTYNGFKLNGNGVVDSFFTWFWESNVLNAHAVRNRLILVKKELKKIISQRPEQQEIKIVSLASGSARAIIEVMAELKGVDIKARFVDMSRDALNYSKGLAQEYQVVDQIDLVRSNVMNIEKFCNDWQPDIVEMVGLMDYLEDKIAIEMIGKIYHRLGQNGSLIFSNINNNPEQRFVEDIVDWFQIYRHPDQLGELLIAGGFDSRNCQIIREPLGIQTVAIGKKSK